MAVFGNFLTAGQIDGQFTKTQIDLTACELGERYQMLILRKAGIDLKRIFVNIEGTADTSGFIIAFMDKRKAGFSLFHGIHQQAQAEQHDADGQKQFFSHDKNRN